MFFGLHSNIEYANINILPQKAYLVNTFQKKIRTFSHFFEKKSFYTTKSSNSALFHDMFPIKTIFAKIITFLSRKIIHIREEFFAKFKDRAPRGAILSSKHIQFKSFLPKHRSQNT